MLNLVDYIEKKNAGIAPCLVGFEMNLIDTMWPTRPQVPRNSLKLHPMSLSGEGVSEKLKRVRDSLIKDSADAIVVSALDQVSPKHLENTPFVFFFINS